MSKYSEEELKEMAEVVMENRGTREYRMLTDALCFFTQLPLAEVVREIEEMRNYTCR